MTQVTAPISTPERIEQIPVHPSARKARVVSIASTMLAALGIGFWYFGPRALSAFLLSNAPVEIHLQSRGLVSPIGLWFGVFGVVGTLCGIVGLLSLRRSVLTYHMLRAVLLLVYPATLGYVILAWAAVFSLVGAGVAIEGSPQDRTTGFALWWSLAWPALLATLYVFWLHVMLRSRPVFAAFTGDTGEPMSGDRILEDWRTHGRDPRARKSFYASVATHLTVLILIPWLLQTRGCVEPYRVPKGSGNPVVALVQIVKPQKKKKKTLTLRPNSAIIFDVPDPDDSQTEKVMEQMTQARYEARVNANPGKMGSGGGTQGGWPAGTEDYLIRFIRLNHGGQGWDDGMDDSGADVNFLRYVAQVTPFKKIAAKGESHSIALLAKYPDDGFPPFVYLTGNAGLGRVSDEDAKILREYCLKGGMLIADAGSPSFDKSFRELMRRVFPGNPLLDIADDDMLYQLPFGFPNGAPAFWHHGGRRALGIKHEGRWIAFYHPGDMNDAWKSPGFSDVSPEVRDAAMQLGVNVLYYSFTQWNDVVTRTRK